MFMCEFCSAIFTRKDNLKRHVQLHSDSKFCCNFCDFNDFRKDNLKRHVKMKHVANNKKQINGYKNIPKFVCSVCDFQSFYFKQLLQHYSSHDIEIKHEELKFSSFEEFSKWKEEEEKSSCNRYIQKSSIRKSLRGNKITFYCHRSGTYRPRGLGKRKLKSQGSKKIGKTCPAQMCATLTSDEFVTVDYICTHIGHEPDLCHLNLSKLERRAIANKISLRVPFEEILLDARKKASSDCDVERCNIITRKDLLNIERSYNLTALRDTNRENNMLREELLATVSDSILFLKTQGQESIEHPELIVDDFCIVIMNNDQKNVIEKFCENCVCIDSTHGGCAFLLTTLMVVDDLHQGFPGAFMISNKSNKHFMTIFFKEIKKKVGTVKSRIFMSDTADMFYEAWLNVMEPAHKLFCAWHVDSLWQKHLKRKAECSHDQKSEIYKKLRFCLQETDCCSFTSSFNKLVDDLKSKPELLEFGKYLEDNFLENVKYWAYCYREHTAISCNVHLERMHNVLKYIYIRGKRSKQIDTCIYVLLNFVNERLIGIEEDKLTSKLSDILKRHDASKSISADDIVYLEEEEEWVVSSCGSTKLYCVKQTEKQCNACRLVCTFCKICIHKFICSCPDSAIKWSMCKHIHAVAQKQMKLKYTPVNSEGKPMHQEISYSEVNKKMCLDEQVHIEIPYSEVETCSDEQMILENTQSEVEESNADDESLLQETSFCRGDETSSKGPMQIEMMYPKVEDSSPVEFVQKEITNCKLEESTATETLFVVENFESKESSHILGTLLKVPQICTNFSENKKHFLNELLTTLDTNINTPEDLSVVSSITKSILPTLESARSKLKLQKIPRVSRVNKIDCSPNIYEFKKYALESASNRSKPIHEGQFLSLELMNFAANINKTQD